MLNRSPTRDLPYMQAMSEETFFAIVNGFYTFFGIAEDDVMYGTLPLYHTSGGVIISGQMIVRGCTLVLRKKFSASHFWTDCIDHKCTIVFYIGELCRYLLAQPIRPTDTQHCVRMAIGNGLRPQVWESFQKRFQVRDIREFYGATEGNVGTANTVGKVGSCGFIPFLTMMAIVKVYPGTQEFVKDGNGYCVLAGVNEPGMLIGAIKPRMSEFDGYNDEEANKRKRMHNVFKPGDSYYVTGDLMRADEEGFLYFCDRTGDTFRWKGENVSTTEVEGTISHLLDQREVVAYGVELPGTEGRAGMVAIVGTADNLDLSSLIDQLRLSLPPYAVPIFVRLVDQVDLTSTFKLQKVRFTSEGYNLDKISDPLYFLDPTQKVYIPLTRDIYQQLLDCSMRL